jgi:DNA invertase Pin-like site-specific DNA recombinase
MSIYQPSGNLSAASTQRMTYLPGQVIGYPRKSTAGENANKSIEDQIEEILEVAEEYGLPMTREHIWAEEIGCGGNLHWEGGGTFGLGLDTGPRRYRPVLTKLMQAVACGEVKCIVVWAQDRLWRDVGICEAAITVLGQKGVQLYDRNGPVDISTPEGRNKVRNTAVAAQNYREMCAVNSPRGIKRTLKKGGLATNPNVLGFRSGGRHTRTVIPQPAELDMVRRIFRLFDAGEVQEDAAHTGPLSCEQIANLLAKEDYKWTPDLIGKRGKKRNEFTADFIYDWQVRQVLSDCRYRGRQLNYEEEWPCPLYLIDGKEVIDEALWERVQAKLRSQKRIGGQGQEKRAMTGILRCGLCFQGLNARRSKYSTASGEVKCHWFWDTLTPKVEAWAWCEHDLPHVKEETLDTYIDEVLAPLLAAELRDQQGALNTGNREAAIGERLRIERELSEIQRKLDALPDFIGELTRDEYRRTKQKYQTRRGQLELQLKGAIAREQGIEDSRLLTMESLGSLPPAARRDAIRAILRWAAVIPSGLPREPDPKYKNKRTRPATDAGWLVFLTDWGTYHTAKIERRFTGETDHRQVALWPARADEVIGSVAEFPDPERFAAGVARAYAGRHYEYSPAEVLPGYELSNPLEVAEFEVDEMIEDFMHER